MEAYLLSHARFAEDLSGFGSFKVGGRWNPKGYYALYLSEHPCGAILEALIHMPPQIIPNDYCMITLQISRPTEIEAVAESELPLNWRQGDYDVPLLQTFGKARLFDKRILGISVPSAVAYPSCNFILNTKHEYFHDSVKIAKIKAYVFDPRLLQSLKIGAQ